MNDLNALGEALAPARAFMHLDDEYTTFEQARVVVVPVPFDGTTCYRPGTREGPQAIIDASRNLELYDAELQRSPYEVGIHTLRAVEVLAGNAPAMVERIEAVTSHLLEAGKFILTLGGDHLTSIGVAIDHRAPGEKREEGAHRPETLKEPLKQRHDVHERRAWARPHQG